LPSLNETQGLQMLLLDYLSCIGESPSKDSPLFRWVAGRTGMLTAAPVRGIDICRMMKRRLAATALPTNLSPHSCRVATVTDLLNQGISLEDVQFWPVTAIRGQHGSMIGGRSR
jgi:hypothetical protein